MTGDLLMWPLKASRGQHRLGSFIASPEAMESIPRHHGCTYPEAAHTLGSHDLKGALELAGKWVYVLGSYTAQVLVKNKVAPGATYSQPEDFANVRETMRNTSEEASISHILTLDKSTGKSRFKPFSNTAILNGKLFTGKDARPWHV